MDLGRSGMVTVAMLAVLLLSLFLIFRERGRGHFHKLTTTAAPPEMPGAPQPGGQDAITLSRYSLLNGAAPEFLSTTLMPGLGMNIQQMKVTFPLKGEWNLLQAPSLEDETKEAASLAADADTSQSDAQILAQNGAPILAWISRGSVATDDLNRAALSVRPADKQENHGMPDGGDATAIFNATDSATPGGLPPGIELRTSTLMSGHGVELMLTARNTTAAAIPLRLGWMPHFVLPSGERSQMRLHVPMSTHNAEPEQDHMRREHDFNVLEGREIGSGSVDMVIDHLARDFMSAGPQILLHDPASGYAIRMTALSPNIHTLRVVAPADQPWITLILIADSEKTLENRVAEARGAAPSKGLAPGASMYWKVRLELTEPVKQQRFR